MNICEVGSEWPGGITDGLALNCCICRRKPQFDFTVTDDSWRKIAPEELHRDVICLPCFARLAALRQIYISDVLERVQFVGIGETIVLNPDISYRYGIPLQNDKEDI